MLVSPRCQTASPHGGVNRGLSRRRGNSHVRFLGGWAGAIPPGYPAARSCFRGGLSRTNTDLAGGFRFATTARRVNDHREVRRNADSLPDVRGVWFTVYPIYVRSVAVRTNIQTQGFARLLLSLFAIAGESCERAHFKAVLMRSMSNVIHLTSVTN